MIGTMATLYPVVVACNIVLSSCFLVSDPDAPYRHEDQCMVNLPMMVSFASEEIKGDSSKGSTEDYELLICCSTTKPDESAEKGNINCLEPSPVTG